MSRPLMIATLLVAMKICPAAATALDDARAGIEAYSAGRVDQATEALTRAIQSGDLADADLAVTLNNRAVALDALGRYDEAIADYERALKLKPDDPKAKTNLRLALLRRGDTAVEKDKVADALRDYDRAIAVGPTSADSFARRGRLRLEQGNALAALADLQQAKTLAPDDDAIAELVGEAQRAAMSPTAVGTQGAASMRSATRQEEPSGQQQGTRLYRVSSAVNLRAGPDKTAASLMVLQAGQLVDAVGETDGWMAIQLEDGRVGYVYQQYLALARP